MCITAHYVDAEWNLKKKIISFCQIANHKGETIGKLIESCLLEWGIEKVFTVTMDNASANDVAAGFIRRRVNAWKGSVLGGEHLHVRCGAHIVNLIVNDGLHKLHDSIAAIRNSVRYIHSSLARLLKFKACAEKERINYKGGLVLDVATRWNSTYMMLDVALKFEKAFTRYEEEDDKFLTTFYDVTLKFSGTLHVTSNNFYHEICEIHSQLNDFVDANDPLLSLMAASMKEKYDKYWGNADNINPLLFVAVVLDPRYKMRYLKYCFEAVYDFATVARLIVKVESVLQSLYTCYNVGSKGADNQEQGQYGGTKLNECVDDIHSFDFLSGDENEKMDSRTSKEKLKGKIIDVIDA
ncbi:zinc finger BED domain-containing protein RICESLEEPER 2-like [Daucus carota subsp. sativus]|uniref:zinc finger BED domain-containing protein RICESLEEPER 2-like n=1 Tax=Daucus carota subsp. sativus TaxID=79200 RepID=UPI003083BFCE